MDKQFHKFSQGEAVAYLRLDKIIGVVKKHGGSVVFFSDTEDAGFWVAEEPEAVIAVIEEAHDG